MSVPGSKPTVGRIVWYYDEGGPYAAIVVKVHDQGPILEVDLVTFGAQSIYFQRNIRYSDRGDTGTWSWPPRI